jgi:hypothetical protein
VRDNRLVNHTPERFVRWQPTADLPRALDANSFVHDFGKGGGVRITFVEPRNGGRIFRVDFARELAFRLANESFRLKVIEALKDALPWPTFKVENSEWVEWFHEQTPGAYRDWPVQHFLFIGEDVVEVLSTENPTCIEMKK